MFSAFVNNQIHSQFIKKFTNYSGYCVLERLINAYKWVSKNGYMHVCLLFFHKYVREFSGKWKSRQLKSKGEIYFPVRKKFLSKEKLLRLKSFECKPALKELHQKRSETIFTHDSLILAFVNEFFT